MGKEAEGIANDNLYRENLDAFQMQWWKACRSAIEDNGSAYIWGNAEDLWRLWYVGGLKASERLTFRNEIVWP
jgi:DNA modification methylase